MLNYNKIFERILEETGNESLSELNKALGAKEGYVYAQKERGISRGYWEKIWKEYPNIDLNYIIWGQQSHDMLHAMIQRMLDDTNIKKSKKEKLVRRFKSASASANRQSPREGQYIERIIEFFIDLLELGIRPTHNV